MEKEEENDRNSYNSTDYRDYYDHDRFVNGFVCFVEKIDYQINNENGKIHH